MKHLPAGTRYLFGYVHRPDGGVRTLNVHRCTAVVQAIRTLISARKVGRNGAGRSQLTLNGATHGPQGQVAIQCASLSTQHPAPSTQHPVPST